MPLLVGRVLLVYTGLDGAGLFQGKDAAGLGSFPPFASVSSICIHLGAQLRGQQPHRGTTSHDKCGGMRERAHSCKQVSCFWLCHVCWHPICWKKLHGWVQSQKVESIPLVEIGLMGGGGRGLGVNSFKLFYHLNHLPESTDESIFRKCREKVPCCVILEKHKTPWESADF